MGWVPKVWQPFPPSPSFGGELPASVPSSLSILSISFKCTASPPLPFPQFATPLSSAQLKPPFPPPRRTLDPRLPVSQLTCAREIAVQGVRSRKIKVYVLFPVLKKRGAKHQLTMLATEFLFSRIEKHPVSLLLWCRKKEGGIALNEEEELEFLSPRRRRRRRRRLRHQKDVVFGGWREVPGVEKKGVPSAPISVSWRAAVRESPPPP